MIDLENTKIIDIIRNDKELVLHLDKAFCLTEQEPKLLINPQIVIAQVISEIAEFYSGDSVKGVHPNPSFPLDEIQTFELSSEKLLLSGMLNNIPWFTWLISFKPNTLKVINEART